MKIETDGRLERLVDKNSWPVKTASRLERVVA